MKIISIVVFIASLTSFQKLFCAQDVRAQQIAQLKQLLDNLKRDVQKSDADLLILRRSTWNSIQDLDAIEDQFEEAENEINQIVADARAKKEAEKKGETVTFQPEKPKIEIIADVSKKIEQEPKIEFCTPKIDYEKVKKAEAARAQLTESKRKQLDAGLNKAITGRPSSSIYFETIESILQAGANPNYLDEWGQTPLTNLADNYYNKYMENWSALTDVDLKNIVQYLINYGADINMSSVKTPLAEKNEAYRKRGFGLTPLFTAIKTDNIRFASILMELGADPFIADADGQTPLEYLKEPKKHKVYTRGGKLKLIPPSNMDFIKQFESYMKEYKTLRTQCVSEASQMPLPISNIVSEYLFGEKPQRVEQE